MVTLIMLGIVTLMFTFGICEYRGILSSIDAAHAGGLEQQDRTNQYHADATHFAEMNRRYQDTNLPWVYRTCIGLRTQWLLGGSL